MIGSLCRCQVIRMVLLVLPACELKFLIPKAIGTLGRYGWKTLIGALLQVSSMYYHSQGSMACKYHKAKKTQRTSDPVNGLLTPCPGIYFNAFTHVYSPRAGADNPLGTNVDVNRKPLSPCPFTESFKKSLLSMILFTFYMILYMYIAPG